MAQLYVAFRRARHALESIGAQLSFANRSARSLASRSNRSARVAELRSGRTKQPRIWRSPSRRYSPRDDVRRQLAGGAA